MTLLVFIFLLAFVQARSSDGKYFTSSPLLGPRQVTGLLYGSVTVKCFYQATKVNRHDRKYWCKESTRQCSTIISSNGYLSREYEGRATITDFPDYGLFTIEILGLRKSDMGTYKCGIGINNKLFFRVKLDVSEDSVIPEEAQLFYIKQQGAVTITCDFGNLYGTARKYLCRMTENQCSTVIDASGNVNPSYKGRVLLNHNEAPGSFNIFMTQLKRQDSGLYLCGAGWYGISGETKELNIHIYEEPLLSKGNAEQPLVKGVLDGSVSVECYYDPKGNVTLKYLCKWRKNGCTQLINNFGDVLDSYEGRIVMHDNPENGTFTVILNQLQETDAGYYWCMTDGEQEKKSTTELKIIEGQPNLKGLKEINIVAGSPLSLTCSYPCKYYSYNKYWCKWKNTACDPLSSYELNQTGLVVNCDKDSRILSLNFDHVAPSDQGWYWCGVKYEGRYGETMAVYLRIEGAFQGSEDAPDAESNRDAAILGIDSRLRKSKIATGVENPTESPAEHNNSKVLLSVLIPLGVMFLLLATIFALVKFKIFKNSDRVSVASYRTNISMTDFENASQYGAKDNACMEEAHETQLGEINEYAITTGSPKEAPKSTKRGSKEEAEMAYSTFLLNSESISATSS
ncbi:polymeric immunoglobulin receptor-like [Heteronotia binoei]|uniref:polymeric immunoglobulin receptor-like n=1 Tax=Heteronotia binoei TaxID=13085 RepID=UPI00292F2454|nr:polymeric immunoglobulin receptor-like [Heteronotia binoei]